MAWSAELTDTVTVPGTPGEPGYNPANIDLTVTEIAMAYKAWAGCST